MRFGTLPSPDPGIASEGSSARAKLAKTNGMPAVVAAVLADTLERAEREKWSRRSDSEGTVVLARSPSCTSRLARRWRVPWLAS
jgi:hypothetical protein